MKWIVLNHKSIGVALVIVKQFVARTDIIQPSLNERKLKMCACENIEQYWIRQGL